MAKYDLNGDNAITLQELTDKKKSLFSQLDSDQDGVISFVEYEGIDSAKRKVLLKSRFDRLDENQDGQVTENEYASFVGRFNHLDSDGDGALSSGEVAQKKLASQDTNNAHCLLWFCFRSNL
ncbi:EF-hand domain-containing protein [Pseudomaricurvus hydrocarbonicus]